MISRRDFLKLGWKIAGSSVAARLLPASSIKKNGEGRPNIVVLVCDSMTAQNMSLYGYPRQTSPNLERLANRALIYHRHYANGNFTSPGTSSILTGLRPWTHRAINLSGLIKKDLIKHNVFNLLGREYFTQAYTQNQWVSYLLDQFFSDIDSVIPVTEFGVLNKGVIEQNFKNDHIIANHALTQTFYYDNSLLLNFLYGIYQQMKMRTLASEDFPAGLPTMQYYDYRFSMDGLFDGIADEIIQLGINSNPYFAYFHIYPPHNPYAPRKDFIELFSNDGYKPTEKKSHNLGKGDSQASLDSRRSIYDAFIANIDMEIGRLVDRLSDSGDLKNTYFILTSDHGEMFERGTEGHVTPLLHEPIIHIPLMILAPGNQTRQDITTPTNSIDLLPTILHLAGQEIPASCEGNILPGLGGIHDANRSVITMEAKESYAHKPFTRATYSIIKGNYKLIYYSGYDHKYKEFFEFYDLGEDSDEIQDKFSSPRFQPMIEEMKKELFESIYKANQNI
jgi:hypothetical protein